MCNATLQNKTGELICRQDPVYGGKGDSEPKFDEAGYILQPPCLWGDGPGLEPMPLASGVTFTVRATTNSTYGHHGEMAFPVRPWPSISSQHMRRDRIQHMCTCDVPYYDRNL